MPKYYTYIVNYYNEENDFDYFIFHSKTELNSLNDKSYNEVLKQFLRLRKLDDKLADNKNILVEHIFEYKEKNYPKAN